MNVDILNLLNQSGDTLVKQIQANLLSTGTDATNKTSQSLAYEISGDKEVVTLSIVGRKFFATVETGRKATPGKKPSPDMVASIYAWQQAVGLTEGVKGKISPYAIAVAINEKGTKLWRDGGRKDIFTQPGDDMVAKIGADILTIYSLAFKTEVIKVYGSNNSR